jgi:hypothetical protein
MGGSVFGSGGPNRGSPGAKVVAEVQMTRESFKSRVESWILPRSELFNGFNSYNLGPGIPLDGRCNWFHQDIKIDTYSNRVAYPHERYNLCHSKIPPVKRKIRINLSVFGGVCAFNLTPDKIRTKANVNLIIRPPVLESALMFVAKLELRAFSCILLTIIENILRNIFSKKPYP